MKEKVSIGDGLELKHIKTKHLFVEKRFDEDEIRTHAGRAQWISSPSP
jgi:hypothetical protein